MLAALYNPLTLVPTYFDWLNDVVDDLTEKLDLMMLDSFREASVRRCSWRGRPT